MTDGLIAIVGAACRFPGASDLEAFWDLLTSGTDAVSEVDPGRWSTRFYHHPVRTERGKSYTWAAGLLTDVDMFEPAFFGISPREAAQMDPQQRLMLELVWHAVEDAGIPASRLAGSDTGVYIGASTTDYRDLRLDDPSSADSYFMTGGTLSIIANRVSYVFDLRGPSLTVDTACSSSLVALHQACEALSEGRIGAAVVGGVNLLLAPYPFIGFCRASMLSRRGRCFAFDERADGYVRGEGGGAVLLKPLRQAVADGDAIRAVIRATGINSDGRTVGLSLPNQTAQAELIRTVCQRAGITADDLAFFEMHGTGTPAGDPIEAAAVGRSLGQSRREPLPIGSVKTNIGHLEPASGMAGLIKATLALERRLAPPTLHCEVPNPNIPFGELNLRLLQQAHALPESAIAGVNSFGFGGANAHVVLAAAPTRTIPAQDAGPLPPLLVSARTQASLRELASDWRDAVAAAPRDYVAPLLRAAARCRDHHPERLVVRGEDGEELLAALDDFLAEAESAAVVTGTAVREGRLAFVFAGNGAQWPGMGREAYHASAAFRAAVAAVDAELRPGLGWSVAASIESGVEPDSLARADVAQPLLFAIQVGIVSVLRDLGILPAAHVGHSVGEIAAAWASGALSLAEAARVVVARSRQQERTRGHGKMAALALGADAASELIAELGAPLEIGAINAGQSVTVSGPVAAIEKLAAETRRRGIGCRVLDLDFAFHSAAMDPVRGELLADLAGLASAGPAGLVSTVTGKRVGVGELDADYWWRNIRNPVRFTDALRLLVDEGCRIFVEIGPHPVLQAYLHDALRAAEGQGRVLATLNRRQERLDPFPGLAAKCFAAGYDFTQSPRFAGSLEPRGLPLYPWHREHFWFDRTVEHVNLVDPAFEHPLLGFRQNGPTIGWLNHLDPQVLPWLGDHAVEGVPVLPAAAVLEMALAAARLRRPEARSLAVADVELRRPLPFDAGHPRELRTLVSSEEGDWELSSRPRLSSEPLTLHAVARLTAVSDAAPQPEAGWDAGWPTQGVIEGGGIEGGVIEGPALYDLAARLGLDYGPSFQTVAQVELIAADRAFIHLDPAAIGPQSDTYLLHPALLDGALQGLLALLAASGAASGDATLLPWRFGTVRLFAPFGRLPVRAAARLTRSGTRSAAADLSLFDEQGAIVADLRECWFRRVELARRGAIADRAFRLELVPAPLDEAESPAALDGVGEKLIRWATASVAGSAAAEQGLLLDALVASVAYDAAVSIVDPGIDFTIGELIEAGALVSEAAPLLTWLLRLLERFGAAQPSGPGWRLVSDNDLPETGELWRLLLAETPEMAAELALLAAASESLPGLLAGASPAAERAPAAMLEHLVHAAPTSAAALDLVGAALRDLAAEWPHSRPLRVLEIGADSYVTRRVTDCLATSGAGLAYVAAHPDRDQAARLRLALENVPGSSALCWGPEADSDELAGARFDLIFVPQAVGGRQLDPTVLPRLLGLLAPGGLLLGMAPEPNPLWDLTFGQSSEWWQEDRTEVGLSPLRSGDDWRSELALAGFAAPGVAAIPGPWPGAVFWGRAPRNEATGRTKASAGLGITLVSAGGASPAQLREALAEAGHRVTPADPTRGLAAADTGAADAETAGEAILLQIGEAAGDPVVRSAEILAFTARVAAAAAQRQCPLWIVTSGGQQGESGPAGLVGAAVWGFGRVLINEMPRLTLRLIDLPAGSGEQERATLIARELAADSPETEIVWTPAGRHVFRLRRDLPPRWAHPQDNIRLTSTGSGGLDSLGWSAASSRAPGPGEVAIAVKAAGLNFRDVMWGMGLLPEEALIDGFAGPTFGLECAGVVRAIGPGVEDLAVGDRVMGFAPASLSSEVITASHAAIPIPPEMDFAAAATIPVAFVTAVYALGTLARVAPGEHVLIHAAAGGVGLAAIQYAKHRGAVVIASAGSESKRAFLRLAGADHVVDSRNLGFADAVRAITNGAGVDVVLNSLSGEAMEQSLGVLKPFGRFLELGKRDFYLNRRIHLRPMRQNISYYGIDVDQLPMQRPAIARELLAEVASGLSEGALRPLAYRRFSFAAADEAFRLMQASGHIGKIVLLRDDNAGVRLRPESDIALRRDGTYLVTGGLSGFGCAAARWLAARGAGHIALIGRRGAATPGAADQVAELQRLGAAVSVHAADVADPQALRTVLVALRAGGPPLRGVVHAASAIGDGLASAVEGSTAETVLRPKLGGAIALDRLTRDDPLDLFLLFSSATTLLGAPGQGVYVAANLALESLVRQRRAEGRPGLAVGWGPIADAGYLADRPEAREALARRLGATPMPAEAALAALPALLGSGLPVVAFAETSWSDARRVLPIMAAPVFSEIRAETDGATADGSLVERLAEAGPEEALALLKTAVAEEAGNILRMPAAGIDPARPLSEMGMDSLMAVELRLALENRLRIELPLMSLAEGTSVASIAARLHAAMAARPQTRELMSLAERYEPTDAARLAAVADAAGLYDRGEVKPSEAAE